MPHSKLNSSLSFRLLTKKETSTSSSRRGNILGIPSTTVVKNIINVLIPYITLFIGIQHNCKIPLCIMVLLYKENKFKAIENLMWDQLLLGSVFEQSLDS